MSEFDSRWTRMLLSGHDARMKCAELELAIRRDPAGRGLLSNGPLAEACLGHLAGAAAELATRGRSIGIVTGFYVPDADPPAVETDGLIGSILLADVLTSLGCEVVFITDERAADAISTTARFAGNRHLEVVACPSDSASRDAWHREFWDATGHKRSHLIAIERSGPTYTPDILRRRSEGSDELVRRFESLVPREAFGHCHNMRGIDIHDWTADLHRLFEERPQHVRTIGIGDGGNEIGMGVIPWADVAASLTSDKAARIPCRTATDWTILAGVSDWGACALAAAVCLAAHQTAALADWTAPRIELLLQRVVAECGVIDGITRRAEPTVDGLPLMTYLQPWMHIRRELSLERE